MSWPRVLLVAGLVAACTGGRVTEAPPRPVVALVGGRVQPAPDAPAIDDGVVVIEGGTIRAVGRRPTWPFRPAPSRWTAPGPR